MRTQQIIETAQNILSSKELQTRKRELSNKKYQEFVEKRVQFKRNDYSGCDQIMPLLQFYKLMAKKVDYNGNASSQGTSNNANKFRAKLWLPDTIVFNDGDGPMWFYSGVDGYVYRQDNFIDRNITSKLCNYTSPDELVALQKKINYESGSNDVRLLSSREVNSMAAGLIRSKGETSVLQKFIKSNGPKAFLVRTKWRNPNSKDKTVERGEHNGHECFVLTSKHDFYSEDIKIDEKYKFLANPIQKKHCTIVPTRKGKHIESTIPYLANLVKFIENNSNLRFKEIVGDFIKDESGTYWLVSVKAYVLEQMGQEFNIRRITNAGENYDLEPGQQKKTKGLREDEYKKLSKCKYCEEKMKESTHKMTVKMIIQTDQALLKRGYKFDFLQRYQTKSVDLVNLYEEHKVCKKCYKLYKETEKLLEVELQLNRVLGIPVSQDTKHDLLNMTLQDIQEPAFKEKLKLKYNTANRTQPFFHHVEPHGTPEPIKAPLYMYRLMVMFNELLEIPEHLDSSKQHSICYTLFNQKHRLPLDFNNVQQNNSKSLFLSLNKIRVFYFFAEGRKQVRDFINQQKSISVQLYCENKLEGTAEFELTDFLSDNVIKREFFKYFSQKAFQTTLSWGLSISIGLNEEQCLPAQNIPLEKHLGAEEQQEEEEPDQDDPPGYKAPSGKQHNGVYLTVPDFYMGLPLNSEWISLFDKKKDQLALGASRCQRQQMMHTNSDLFKYSHSNYRPHQMSNQKSVKKFDLQGIQQNNLLVLNKLLKDDAPKNLAPPLIAPQEDLTQELCKLLDKDLAGYNKAYHTDKKAAKQIKRKIFYL